MRWLHLRTKGHFIGSYLVNSMWDSVFYLLGNRGIGKILHVSDRVGIVGGFRLRARRDYYSTSSRLHRLFLNNSPSFFPFPITSNYNTHPSQIIIYTQSLLITTPNASQAYKNAVNPNPTSPSKLMPTEPLVTNKSPTLTVSSRIVLPSLRLILKM